MAASSRAGNINPGSDDFAAFQHQAGYTNGHHTNGNGDHYEYDQYEEELDFEPQNGYHEQELMPALAEAYPDPEPQGKKGKMKAMKNPER